MQVVQYQGFCVNLDFHSIGVHETLVTGDTPFSGADDYTLYDMDVWVGLWYFSILTTRILGMLQASRMTQCMHLVKACMVTGALSLHGVIMHAAW